MPILSLITINYNNDVGLRKTFESVSRQTCKDFEYIVIDGGSNDGSVAIIEEYGNQITYWVSEPDRGIYHAMNKGIGQASGDHLLFLNSGDFLVNEQVLKNCQNSWSDADLIYGDLVVDDSGKVDTIDFPDKLTFRYFLKNTLPHPCTFIKRSLFERVGLYNESLRIVSDWEFFIKAVCTFNCTYNHIKLPIAVIDTQGISRNPENLDQISKERNAVLSKDFPAFIDDYLPQSKLSSYLSRLRNKIRTSLK